MTLSSVQERERVPLVSRDPWCYRVVGTVHTLPRGGGNGWVLSESRPGLGRSSTDLQPSVHVNVGGSWLGSPTLRSTFRFLTKENLRLKSTNRVPNHVSYVRFRGLDPTGRDSDPVPLSSPDPRTTWEV